MQTPYEQTGQWTSRDDGEAFLDAAATQYGFPVETLATSVEGRPVRAALIGAHPDEAEQVVLLVAMQHGNEPASREGAYALIRDLAASTEPNTADYLERTAWVIIPTLNPDRCHMQRRNANNVDLNRDWEDKSQPETWAVLDVLDNWQPTLVIDAHEMFHGFDAWVGLSTPSTNVPVHPEISRVSGLAHEHAIQAIIDSGSTYADYGETGAMTLRTYAGTQHASSILIETYAWNEEREGHLRVADQITVMHALAEHHQLEYDQYRAASDVSRNPALAATGGGVPFFGMWDNPKAYIQGTAIVDAYLQTSNGKVRVYDHLGTLL